LTTQGRLVIIAVASFPWGPKGRGKEEWKIAYLNIHGPSTAMLGAINGCGVVELRERRCGVDVFVKGSGDGLTCCNNTVDPTSPLLSQHGRLEVKRDLPSHDGESETLKLHQIVTQTPTPTFISRPWLFRPVK
jgi:hypothetical protein